MEYNLDRILFAMLGSQELVAEWWNSANVAFSGDTPQQVFDSSNYYQVVEYILKHSNGQGH